VSDPVFEGFLKQQFRQGMALAQQSDLLDLQPMDPGKETPSRYLARFHCKGLVRERSGSVVEASEFHVGIWFPSDYLRQVDPLKVITWLHPLNVWHPNIALGLPVICLGRIAPATELVDLLYEIYEVITYQNWAPHDGLNPEACQWARNHQDRFPTDRRPLKRRTLNLQVQDAKDTSNPS